MEKSSTMPTPLAAVGALATVASVIVDLVLIVAGLNWGVYWAQNMNDETKDAISYVPLGDKTVQTLQMVIYLTASAAALLKIVYLLAPR